MSARFLTKSRFKVGYECPSKLYFLDNPAYGNTKDDNAFLKALAQGGFQVGELAKLYYPGGVEVKTLDKAEALKQTAELLKQDSAVIFEGALQHGPLFIRADILIKQGHQIEVIEVKAKSFNPDKDQFYNKTSLKKGVKKINSAWEPYLIDVAFQCHVLKLAMPSAHVSGSLMLADKTSRASVDGLNQKFFLDQSADGRTSVKLAEGITKEQLGEALLVRVPVDDQISVIWQGSYEVAGRSLSFDAYVEALAKACGNRDFIKPQVGPQCKSCEFRIGDELKAQGLQSGFEQCWSEAKQLKAADFERPFVFDLWMYRKSAEALQRGQVFLDQLQEDDIFSKTAATEKGLSQAERQWLQVEKVRARDNNPFLDVAGLRAESASWIYPLHFIDFETTMVAIPFHRGRRPYEQIAFQFSHHKVEKDGSISHHNEYINQQKGKFPNFDFVRALKASLEGDHGTIFRYAAHENTVLCQIKEQLLSCTEPVADSDELIAFIESITSDSDLEGEAVAGDRCMVDLCELVKKYFYHPKTGGSNSIKKVLPAVLDASAFLKTKYAEPVYGAKNGIQSRNFQDWAWIRLDSSGAVIDPYKGLPPIFSDIELAEMDALITEGCIADGGAAMTAYSRMQFTEMTQAECERVSKALLKYCELDTFAMVLIWEYWQHEVAQVA